jgi:hypothetical protein
MSGARKLRAVVLAAGLLCPVIGSARSFEMGMIYWPPQGTATAPELIGKGISLTLENSDHMLVQLPWNPGQTNLAELASWIAGIAHEHHKHLTIAVDWQEATRTGVLAGKTNPWRFADDATRRQFIDSVTAAAKNHRPDYFVVGVEVNYYARLFPDDFKSFVETYRETKAKIKEVSPATKVLVTFQYEALRERKNFDIIRSFDLDILGIATYPHLVGVKPGDVSAKYFAALDAFKMPVGFFETSWPRQEQQVEYAQRILQTCRDLDARLLIWTATTDTEALPAVEADRKKFEVEANWMRYLGLWTVDGKAKPAAKVWQQWRRQH